MTPKMPSEPMNIRSGLGPAPDPGSRRDSIVPAGVTTRRLSTKSSIWVYSVAKWPPARVAIQPPNDEYSNDWGKCRKVSPYGFSAASGAGPNMPAWMRAARDVLSISSTASSRRRSMVSVPS